MDCADGNIIHEQGTLQNGVLTGEYTCDVCNGDGPLEAYSLWSSREAREYITYTGTFDAEGKILTEQPSEEPRKSCWKGLNILISFSMPMMQRVRTACGRASAQVRPQRITASDRK